MSTNDATAARSGVTTADADYNHDVAAATDCNGWSSVLVMAVLTAGGDGSSTITVEPVVRMGTTWGKAGVTATLRPNELVEIAIFGRKVFWHVTAMTAGTTWTIHVGGGTPLRADGARRE